MDTFAQFCRGVEHWTCAGCREAMQEMEKRYTKWEAGGKLPCGR